VCEMAGRLPDHDRYSADDPGVRRCGMRAQEPSPQVVGQEPAGVTWSADGPTQFAGTMMVVAGIWHGLIGLAGLAHDTLLVPVEGYVYAVDLSAWGWAHAFIGVALAALGV